METSLITMEDIEYLAGQSVDNMNVILASMTALMDENNQKTSMLETQTWFQRMSRTISGKNKMTQAEIQQNHDKINLYLSQALSELYERSCIDQQIIMSLGTRLNELYADHIQLKQMLGAFVDKLNQKIISIDNFHMLETEIEQGVYDDFMPVVAMCKVLSQLDNRTLNDKRKLDIIERSLQGKGIISDESASILEYLMALLDTGDREIGIIYMELETLRDNAIAVIFKDVIENYHFLSGLSRKIRKKEEVAKKVIQQNQLDDSIELSLEDIYHELLNAKTMIIPQIETHATNTLETVEEYEELQKAITAFLNYSKKEMMDLLIPLTEKEDGFALYLLSFCYNFIPEYENIKMANDCLERGYISGNVLASIRYAKICKDSQKAKTILDDNICELERMALEGNPFAQYEYAILCSETSQFKIQHNEVNVRELLEKASNQGFWMAKFHLARRYRYGIDGNVDYEKAFRLFNDLDKFGRAPATLELADFYMSGYFVEENKEKAVSLYEKAATNGIISAKSNLARCYQHGIGVQQNNKKAIELYQEYLYSIEGYFSICMESTPIKPIKRNKKIADISYQLYCLDLEEYGGSDDEIMALNDLTVAAKCGNPYALFEYARYAIAKDSEDYSKKFSNVEYTGLAFWITYDLEMAQYCAEKAKEYTDDEGLIRSIEWFEVRITYEDVSNSISELKTIL